MLILPKNQQNLLMKLFKITPLKFLVLLLFFGLSSTISKAQTIKGKVTDLSTNEPLVGATVKLEGTKYITFVKLDGTFSFNKISKGNYNVSASYRGYKNNANEVAIIVADTEAKIVNIGLEPESTQLNDVVISSDKGGDKGARHLEKNADHLVNVLSAKTIQLLPDITVANALQRVSGVTVERNSAGEARYPIIRGMDKRYINTLVNGIKIPSPDNKSRFIPLNLFPSELLERLEVSKSLTPSMEGDAIGGTINLVMKDAPEHKIFNVNFSGGYNSIFSSQDYLSFNKNSVNSHSPAEINGPTYVANPSDFSIQNLKYTPKNTPINSTVGFTYGNRFGKNKKLGVIVSGSYQNQYSGTNSFVFTTSTSPNLDNKPAFENLKARQYSLNSERMGATAKMDYKFNPRNKISLFSTYVKLNDLQVRQSIDSTSAINQLLSYSSRSLKQKQSIYNATLQGVHKLTPSFIFDWSAVYSMAKNAIPDLTSFSHGGLSINIDPVTGGVKLTGDDILSSMSRSWTRNSDKDWSGLANLTKQTKLVGKEFELKFGSLIRHKNRDNFYNGYTLNPLLPTNGTNQLFTTIDNAVFTFKGSAGVPDLNGNNYTFIEDVFENYLQGKLQLSKKLEVLGGVRVEYTWQKYNTQLPPTAALRSGSISYTDVLPSVQFKYQLNQEQAFRLSYYRANARPQFAELIPDGPEDYDLFKQIGNPQGLKHPVADNYDFRYELFPGNTDQILLGAFYKRIQDPIELSVVRVGYNTQNFQPINIGTATNYGLEAVVIKYMGAFGVSANYTYTHSSVTNDNMLYKYYDPILRTTEKIVSETRPLQGQADHIGNLSLIYKNPKIGFDMQVAGVYTGERLSLLNPYIGLHQWLQPTTQLDVSFEKRLAHKFTFYGKINNLTNTPSVTALHQSYTEYAAIPGVRQIANQTDPNNKIIVQKDYYKTSFLFGFRYKL
jgi:outer membrane receptor protein involved in Fe transport